MNIQRYLIFNKYRIFTLIFFPVTMLAVWYFVIMYQFTFGFDHNASDLIGVDSYEIQRNLQISAANLDNYIASTYTFTQLAIPILVAMLTVIFSIDYTGYFKHQLFRSQSTFGKIIVKKILYHSAINAITVYLGYFLYLTLGYFLSVSPVDTDRVALDFIFGTGFYYRSPFLYQALEGLLRFFIFPFVYSAFGCSAYTLFKKKQAMFSLPIGYYFLATMIFGVVLGIHLLSPMYSLGVSSFCDAMLYTGLCPLIIPLILSILMINFTIKRSERVG